MNTGRAYDPWEHAAHLGLHVVEGPLREPRRGEYHPDTDTIVLTPGMTRRQARSTLAHEVAHAVLGHTPCEGRWRSRQERQAQWTAVRWLISTAEYALAEALYGPHPGAIAHELDVTRAVVRTYRRHLSAILGGTA